MALKRSLFLIISACILSSNLFAQVPVTKVHGRVVDGETGEGLPYVGVYFNGSTVGQATDNDGYYAFETRDLTLKQLVTSMTGYEPEQARVIPGRDNKIDFSLVMVENNLNEVVFNSNQKEYIRGFLKKIDDRREVNDPERRPQYECDLYSKMRFDIDDADKRLNGENLKKQIGFVFNYMDSSKVTGKATLPTLLSETNARRYHNLNELQQDQEVLLANQVSGVDQVNLLLQYTGSLELKANFYDDFIELFSIKLASPLQLAGQLYYSYFVVDSIPVDGRKTYVVHFRPKFNSTTPLFKGEMLIDAEDYALKSIKAKMMHEANVNWIRNVWLGAENKRLPDGTWFHDQDHVSIDFNLVKSDSVQLLNFTGHRDVIYTNPVFENVTIPNPKAGLVYIDPAMEDKDVTYWDSIRPIELDKTEQGIYEMVDSVKTTSFYKKWYGIANLLATSYFDVPAWGIGFGNYTNILSFNDLEGVHLGIGIHSTKELSKKYRFHAKIGAGTKDGKIKGGGGFQWLFSRYPYKSIHVQASHDIYQIGHDQAEFTEENILAALLAKHGGRRLTYMTEASVLYDHEFSMNINCQAGYTFRYVYGGEYVPMVDSRTWDPINGVMMNEFYAQARFSKEEKVMRGHFVKNYKFSTYPVFYVRLYGSLGGPGEFDAQYFRPELTIDYRHRFGPIGQTTFHLNGGTIFGEVPYPFLHMHEGNGTFLLDRKAFACMDYMEFASDTWGTLMVEHSFDGFFFGRIPFLQKANMREVIFFKGTYGTISDKNNGMTSLVLTGDERAQAKMMFPVSMKELGKPYMEVGCGISNIFNIFRVDFNWRLTHRSYELNGETIPAAHLFSINVGGEVRF